MAPSKPSTPSGYASRSHDATTSSGTRSMTNSDCNQQARRDRELLGKHEALATREAGNSLEYRVASIPVQSALSPTRLRVEVWGGASCVRGAANRRRSNIGSE
jgi:hypothetical protein